MTSQTPRLVLSSEGATRTLAVRTYLPLGFMHIMEGFDHLAFVLGLLLLIGLRWRLLAAVTAFTVAHSITLALSVLGMVRLPSAQIEMLVALSILFVALEALRAARGKESLSIRQPWVIAFLFGLLHGFAFAGALTAIGLPPDAVPQALFLFNLGVELGQITFIGSVALLLAVRRFIPAAALRGREARNLAAYAIGTMACFWLLERATMLRGS